MAFVHSWSTSALSCGGGGGACKAETDDVTTSMSAKLQAHLNCLIVWTLPGKRCKTRSRRKVLDCWHVLHHRSCEGFLSPKSSVLNSCCSFLCSEAVVRLMSCLRRERFDDEPTNLCSEFRRERSDNVVEFAALCGDVQPVETTFPGRKTQVAATSG